MLLLQEPREKRDGRRLRLGGVRRQELAFGEPHRRAAVDVGHVELRALLVEILQDVVGAAVGCGVRCREAIGVHRVHVAAELDAELHRFEQSLRPFAVGLADRPVHARHDPRIRAP